MKKIIIGLLIFFGAVYVGGCASSAAPQNEGGIELGIVYKSPT